MQEAIAALSLEHTSAVFIRANMDLWEVRKRHHAKGFGVHSPTLRDQEIEDLLPRFNSEPGVMHPDGNPNVYIDPSKKLVFYAHVKSSDTVLQRYNIVGLPTVLYALPPRIIFACLGFAHLINMAFLRFSS